MKFDPPIALVGLKRTFIGKLGGRLAGVEPHLLLASCFKTSLSATQGKGLDASQLADVIVGCVRNGIGNIGRVASLSAGIPEHVPAMTVDRQCASSMEALAVAACRVHAGHSSALLVGGVESASRSPWLFERTGRAYAYFEPKPFSILLSPKSTGNLPMGETAEMLADEYGLSRDALDSMAQESHRKAADATAQGRFAAEISPVDELDRDESVRPDTTYASLAELKPVFRKGGRLTAGNSSPLNDGAASCLVMSRTQAEAVGVKPDALLRGIHTVGLDPNRMGLGPALVIPNLLREFGLGETDIDLYEINEAFSSQVLAVLAHLEQESNIRIAPDKLNIHGGAIALGHPLGATGLRLIVTLASALKQRGQKRGIAALCVGGGQGMGALVEIPD
jgi:acetyl-CoA C-acetyltransferase